VGDWSLFCADASTQPTISDCALAAAVVSDQTRELWVRVGFAFDQDLTSAKINVRIPRIDYLKKGIFLSTDTEDIGRAFFDECGKDFCRSTVRMNPRNFDAILTAKMLNVQFQTEKDKGVSFSIDMKGFLPTFDEMRKVVGTKKKDASGAVFASDAGPRATSYSLTLRSAPIERMLVAELNDRSSQFGKLVRCSGVPETMIVKARNGVKNLYDVTSWAEAANRCNRGHVVWINLNYDTMQDPQSAMVNLYDRANILRIVRAINNNVPSHRLEFVYSNADGTPVQISDDK
jgi:invasion protein IalB